MRPPRKTIASIGDGPGGKLGMVLLVGLAGLALATVLAFAAPLGWPFELFTHFRAQYAVAAALLAVLLLLVRRPGAAAVAGVLAALHALPALQRSVADDPVAACGGPAFTVVTANLQYSNHDTSRFLDWLAANPGRPRRAAGSHRSLGRHAVAGVRRIRSANSWCAEDPYGIGVMSRWPLRSVERRDFAGDGLPSLSGGLVIQGQPVRFLALHTHWPILPRLAAVPRPLARCRGRVGACRRRAGGGARRPESHRVLAGIRAISRVQRGCATPWVNHAGSDMDGGLLAARAPDRSRARHARSLRRARRGRPLDRLRSSAGNCAAAACFARDSLTRCAGREVARLMGVLAEAACTQSASVCSESPGHRLRMEPLATLPPFSNANANR